MMTTAKVERAMLIADAATRLAADCQDGSCSAAILGLADTVKELGEDLLGRDLPSAESAEEADESLLEAYPVEPYVNLWELITTIAYYQKDFLPNRDNCQAIKNACFDNQYPSFGSELSLRIEPKSGAWTVKVFSHTDESGQYVEIRIGHDGYIQASRGREIQGVREYRSISF